MEKASKATAMPDVASMSPEEREKLKLAMLKKRREKETQLAQEAARTESGTQRSSESMSDVRGVGARPETSREGREDGTTRRGDRKEMTAEEKQKIIRVMKVKEQAKLQAAKGSSPEEPHAATPRIDSSPAGSEQRPELQKSSASTVKLTQSEKARLAKAAEQNRGDDSTRQPTSLREPVGDDSTKRSSAISTGSTGSLTQSERAQLAKAKEKLAAAGKPRTDTAATKTPDQTPAIEPAPDAADSSPTSDTDASDSGLTTDDPLMAGDYRPLKSALKKSKKKPRQNKNIQHNYFMTMRGWRPALVPFPHGLHPKPHKPRHTLWWDNIPKDADHIMAPPPVPKLPEADIDEPEPQAPAPVDSAKADINKAGAKETSSDVDATASKQKAEKSAASSRDKNTSSAASSTSRDKLPADSSDMAAKASRSKEVDEAKLKERELRKQLEKKKLSEAAAQAVVDGSDKPPTKLDPGAERPRKPGTERSAPSDPAVAKETSRSDPSAEDNAKLREAAKIKEAEKLKELEKRRQAEKLKEMEKAKAAQAAGQKFEKIPSKTSQAPPDVPLPPSVTASEAIPPGMDPQLLKAQYATQALLCVLLYQIHDQLAMILLAFFMYQYMIDRQKLADAQKAASAQLASLPTTRASSSSRQVESATRSREPTTKDHAVLKEDSERSAPAPADEAVSKSGMPSSRSTAEVPNSLEKASRQIGTREVESSRSGERPSKPATQAATKDSSQSREGVSSSRERQTGAVDREVVAPRTAGKSASQAREVPRATGETTQKPSQGLELETPDIVRTGSANISRSDPGQETASRATPPRVDEAGLPSQPPQKTDRRRARVEDEDKDENEANTSESPVLDTSVPRTREINKTECERTGSETRGDPALAEKARDSKRTEPGQAENGDREAQRRAPISKKDMTPEMLEAYKRAKAAKMKQLEGQQSKAIANPSMTKPGDEARIRTRSSDAEVAKEMTPEGAEAYRRAKAKAEAEAEAVKSTKEDQNPSIPSPPTDQPPPNQPEQVKVSKESHSRPEKEARREMTPEMIEAYKRAQKAKMKEAALQPGKSSTSRSVPVGDPTTASNKQEPRSSASKTAALASDTSLISGPSRDKVSKSEMSPEMLAAYKAAKEAKSRQKAEETTGKSRPELETETSKRSGSSEPSVKPEERRYKDHVVKSPREPGSASEAKSRAPEPSSVSAVKSHAVTSSQAESTPDGQGSHPSPDTKSRTRNGVANGGDATSVLAVDTSDDSPAPKPNDPADNPAASAERPKPSATAGPENEARPQQPELTPKRLRTTSGREITPDMLAAYERAKRDKRDRERQKLELEATRQQRRQMRETGTHAPGSPASDDRPHKASDITKSASTQSRRDPPASPAEQPPRDDGDERPRAESGSVAERADGTVPKQSGDETRGLTVSVEDEELQGAVPAQGGSLSASKREEITPASSITVNGENTTSNTAEVEAADDGDAPKKTKSLDKRQKATRLERSKEEIPARGETEQEKATRSPAAQVRRTTVQQSKADLAESDGKERATEPPSGPYVTVSAVSEGGRSKHATEESSKSVDHPKKAKERTVPRAEPSPDQLRARQGPSESDSSTKKTEHKTAVEVQAPSRVATQRHKQDDPETKSKRLSLERRLRLRKALRTPLRVTKKASSPGTPVSGPVRGDWPSVEPDELYALMQALEASCEPDQGTNADAAELTADTPRPAATRAEESTKGTGAEKPFPPPTERAKETAGRDEAAEIASKGKTTAESQRQDQLKADPVQRSPSVKGKEKMTPEMLEKYEEAKRRLARDTKSRRGGSAGPDRPPKSAERRTAGREQGAPDDLPSASRLPGPPTEPPSQRPGRSDSSKRRKADMSAKELKAYEEAKRRAMEKRARQEAETTGSKSGLEKKEAREVRPKLRMEDLTPEMVERMQREKEKRRLERARAKKEALGQGSSGLSPGEKEALSQPASPTGTS